MCSRNTEAVKQEKVRVLPSAGWSGKAVLGVGVASLLPLVARTNID